MGGSFCGREDEARTRGYRGRLGAWWVGRPFATRYAMGDQFPHLDNGPCRPRRLAREVWASGYRRRGEVAHLRCCCLRRWRGPARFPRCSVPQFSWSPDLALPCRVAWARRELATRRHLGLRSWGCLCRRPDLRGTATRERGRHRMARGDSRAVERAGAGRVEGRLARRTALAPVRHAPCGGRRHLRTAR